MENTPVEQTTFPDQTPTFIPPPNNYFKFIIIGIVIFVVFVSGGLFLGKTIYSPKGLISNNNISPTIYVTNIPTEIPIYSPTPDPTANWKTIKIETEPTLKLADYQIMLSAGWWRIEHSSNFQNTETFRDTQNVEGTFTYQLTIHETKNINEKTNKPFTTLQSLTGFPYDFPTRIVDGQQAVQVLPHAGSETNYKVLFFSKDNNLIIDIELDTPRDGSKTSEGKILFDQILSTFKFLDQVSARPGEHCGGFITTAKSCLSGYHCQLNNKIPDAGGVCVPDQAKTTCNSDSDCQTGYYCAVFGPLIANQPVRKICVQKGTVVPL